MVETKHVPPTNITTLHLSLELPKLLHNQNCNMLCNQMEVVDSQAHNTRDGRKVMGSHDYIKRPNDLRIRTWPRGISMDDEYFGKCDGSQLVLVSEPEKEYHSPTNTTYETIAKYQREMMELVKDVPETEYELTLRDIVELSSKPKAAQVSPGEENGVGKIEVEHKGGKVAVQKQNVQGGEVMLKMFYPVNFGGKKKSRVAGPKVSPKPVVFDDDKSINWKLRSSYESRETSRHSNKNPNKKMGGCLVFVSTYWSRPTKRKPNFKDYIPKPKCFGH